MDYKDQLFLVVFLGLLGGTSGQLAKLARWCVTTDSEEAKCDEFVLQLAAVKELPVIQNVQDFYMNQTSNEVDFSSMPVLSCVRAADMFDCLTLFDQGEVDLITLEAGEGYFAGRYHSLRPIMSEKYDTDPKAPLEYYAVAVKKIGSGVTINSLRDRKACIPGIGSGAGWVYPISFMLETRMIQVTECNAVVKTVTNFFKQMCLPGALNSFYNPFGNNPTRVCELCIGTEEQQCTSSDPHAGFDGAFKCLDSEGDIAFLRHDTVYMSADDSNQFDFACQETSMRPIGDYENCNYGKVPNNVVMTSNLKDDKTVMAFKNFLTHYLTHASLKQFELACQDTSTRPIGDYENCNYGKVPNNIVMTSNLKDDKTVMAFKNFLTQMDEWFGTSKPYEKDFALYKSLGYKGNRKNLMFNDATLSLVDVGERDRYYSWVGEDFRAKLDALNVCPIEIVRLCVISNAEREKCERMTEVFKGKDIKPNLDCIMARSTQDCMMLVDSGEADLTVLDAGDVYKGGKLYNLVPIAAEDYGDMTHSFKVVAAARKRDLYMTLFNLKDHRACHAGIGRGDGWIIPLNIYIETQQFIPQQCTIFDNIGQLFSRSCIPGALEKEYNPNQKPINLCEGCAGGGFRKCERNSDEQYYGTTGSFRCLVELAGDVAFVHHLTVGDNTDGRNQAIWARNRRSDDYELLCKDGTRTSIENWATCYLGTVPAAALVTSAYTPQSRRDIFWNIFSYGQQFFSSDIDGDFHMFDSGLFYADLIFNDEAVRLIPIEQDMQNYEAYLGHDFISQIHNLDEYQCIPQSAATRPAAVSVLALVSLLLVFLL